MFSFWWFPTLAALARVHELSALPKLEIQPVATIDEDECKGDEDDSSPEGCSIKGLALVR